MPEDVIVWLESESPEMARAIRAAQASFPAFARQAELERNRIVPAFEAVAIKAFFPDPARPGYGEHMFVTDVATDGRSITGTLANEPGFASEFHEGDEVTFPVTNLSDWFLVSNDRGIGGFTIDLVRVQLSPSQRAEYDEHPPFAWFRHREGTTAAEELNAVPECPGCHERGLPLFSDQGELCEVCAMPAVRCECTGCGAPLIRPEGAPKTCHRCRASS